MEFIDISAGAGGFLLGAQRAGFKPILILEPNKMYWPSLTQNFNTQLLTDFPRFADIPRCEALGGTLRVDGLEGRWESICEAIRVLQPRTLFFEAPVRVDPKILCNFFVQLGYSTWTSQLNLSDWIPVRRFSKYIVAIRKDIKTCFEQFPFPDPYRKQSRDDLIINVKGRICNQVFGMTEESAMETFGFQSDFKLGKLSRRRALALSSPTVIQALGEEVIGWTRQV